MSKRIRLSLSAQEKQSTNWSKCFICQEDKHEALKSPPMKIDLAKSGYRTLSKNIPEFAKINEMPIHLDIRRIAEGDDRDACFSQMKHSSRCNDRSSVGAVELFLVNLNDDGTSESLVSRGWCLFWAL
jgi:hypothetical protein